MPKLYIAGLFSNLEILIFSSIFTADSRAHAPAPSSTPTEPLASYRVEVEETATAQGSRIRLKSLHFLRLIQICLALVTRTDNPWLLLATLPLYHPVQDLKMTPLLQFTPVHFLKSTPLPLLTQLCNFEALLGASLISMNQQVLLRPGTPVL